MSEKLRRLIFDTNVLVSAILFPGSQIGQLVAISLLRCLVLVSHATKAELDEVVMRAKFDHYHTPERRRRLLDNFLHNLELVPVEHTVTDCSHAADNKFLELALSGHADFLITGDAHLLVLNPWRGIPILNPAQYLALDPANDLR